MKIAYCFAGHLRDYRRNQYIQENLFAPNSLDFDVFVFTYRLRNSPNGLWHKDNGLSTIPVTKDDEEWIREHYPNIRVFEVDPLTGGDDHSPPEYQKLGSRWTGTRMTEIREAWYTERGMQPNLVVNIRFDVCLKEPVVLPYPQPMTVYGNYNSYATRKGLDGDTFTYASPESMHLWSTPAYPDTLRHEIASYGYVGERLWTNHRKARGLAYIPHKLKMSILRTDGSELAIPL
jgi:hypothetical protein